MPVFDKTELLVMRPVCSAFTAADKTDALVAGNIAKMSFQQWVGTNVALWCCRMNMPLAGRAKLPGVPSSPIATLTKTRRSSANSCRSCVCQSYVELPKEKETAHA